MTFIIRGDLPNHDRLNDVSSSLLVQRVESVSGGRRKSRACADRWVVFGLPFDTAIGVISGATDNPVLLAFARRIAPTDPPDAGTP